MINYPSRCRTVMQRLFLYVCPFVCPIWDGFSQIEHLSHNWLKSLPYFSQIRINLFKWLKIRSFMSTNPVFLQPVDDAEVQMAEINRFFQPELAARPILAEEKWQSNFWTMSIVLKVYIKALNDWIAFVAFIQYFVDSWLPLVYNKHIFTFSLILPDEAGKNYLKEASREEQNS